MDSYVTEGSREIFEELKNYLVDGVSSSFHKTPIEEYPISIAYGKGSHVYDVDGNDYIDYVGGFGPMILGYCPKCVNDAVKRQIDKGSQFSTPTEDLLTLSKMLVDIIPCAEMVSYQNTGTEAVMYALRTARAYTGKEKIVKFEGHYHGWSDEEKISIDANLLSELGPKNRPYKIKGSYGQPDNAGDNIIVLPWNDADVVEETFKLYGNDIAAIIMEAFMCDSGPILPKEGYLERVRELTKQYGVVLIFDEVITGFRMALGGAQEYFGVTPDLSTFAKAVAGGYSLSVIAGKKEIMECGVHASGTFNANPVAVSAAIATLTELSKPDTYKNLEKISFALSDGLEKLGKKYAIPLYTTSKGGIVVLEFGDIKEKQLTDLRDCIKRCDLKTYDRVYLIARNKGIRLTYKRGRVYISTAHTMEDIHKTLDIFDEIFQELSE